MIKAFRHISIAALALLASAAVAAAQTPQFYIGVHGGKSLATDTLSNTDNDFTLDGVGMKGYVAGVHGGLDMQLKDSPVFFGVLGGFDVQNTEFKFATSTFNYNATLGNSWYAGGRAGFVIHGAKVYALAAYRQTEWDNTVAELTSPTLKGYDLGLGIDIPIAKNVSLGLEGISTHYQRSEFKISDTPIGITHEPETLSAMARLNFTFGGGENVFTDRVDPPKQRGGDPKLMGKP